MRAIELRHRCKLSGISSAGSSEQLWARLLIRCRDVCQEIGLPVRGSLEDLVDRLEHWDQISAGDLKEWCRDAGIGVGGKKIDLYLRLMKFTPRPEVDPLDIQRAWWTATAEVAILEIQRWTETRERAIAKLESIEAGTEIRGTASLSSAPGPTATD